MDSDWDVDAKWIFHPSHDDTINPGSLFMFRREFDIATIPQTLDIKVTADTRYRLFLNGTSISIGPCKGVPSAWHYEQIESAAHLLRPGKNVFAVHVLRYSPAHRGNISISGTRKPGLVLLATADNFTLSTDLTWRCIQDTSTLLSGVSSLDLFLSINETVTGRNRQFGWTEPGFDDSAWLLPREITNDFPGIRVSELPWSLTPRTIPPLTETPKKFAGVTAVRETAGSDSQTQVEWDALLRTEQKLVIPAFQCVEVDIQAAEYTTGYLEFSFQAGAATEVRFLCAESYELAPRDSIHVGGAKGNRIDSVNGFLNGEWDNYTVAGRSLEVYEPFWFRTFRFVRLSIKTSAESLTINKIAYRETNYPLEVMSTFSSPKSPTFTAFWDISLRTLKNCMHETYEDCPYYEQTQYSFDSRIQILLTYNLSCDDRLPRKALQDLHASVRPDGLLGFRSPSHVDIVTPTFSLFFPLMVHDHVRYFGDRALAKWHFPIIDGILNFFDTRVGSLGLVTGFGRRWWPFTDWVEGWDMGIPDAAHVGPGTYVSLVTALSLDAAAEVAEFLGRHGVAREYRERKASLVDAINTHCFDGTWYYDGPISDKSAPPQAWLSQHCQVYAIIAGAIEGPRAQELMHRTLEDPRLSQMTLLQAFYLFRALEKTQLDQLVPTRWAPWEAMIAQGLDT